MPGIPRTGGELDERQRAEIAGQVVRGSLSIQDACARHQLSQECILEWLAAFRHSSLRAFDEQLCRTLADQGVDVGALATAEFQGDLGEIAVADLIQTLALGRRDGVISVWHDGHESRIWCVGGEIADAESGKLVGVAAVHRVLAVQHGRVRASFTRVSRPRSVHASNIELILDGARRSDECAVARRRLGSGRYRLASKALCVDAGSTDEASAVLRHFDAPRSIHDALAESELGDLETLTIISGLVAREYLLPEGESSIVPAPSRPLQAFSSPPLVMSLANGLANRGAQRARIGVVLGLALVGLSTWLVPRHPSDARDRPTAIAPVPPGAAAQWEPAPATPSARLDELLPREASPGMGTELGSDAVPAPTLTKSSQPLRVTPTARRRAPRGSGAQSPPPATSARRTPPPSPTASEVTSASPRMQIIDEQFPKMQIVE